MLIPQQDVSRTGSDLKLRALKLSCKAFVIRKDAILCEVSAGSSPTARCYVTDERGGSDG